MKGWTLLVLLVCFCHQSAFAKAPSKEHLCGLLVDKILEKVCLECFEGLILSETPEQFRKCVATFMPPKVANCAVPHPDRALGRMQQYKPNVHHNHTNANLLPNCLKRRMRDMSRYLEKENRYAQQAGTIAKTILLQNVFPYAGPNLLSVISQRYIFNNTNILALLEMVAKSCKDAYHNDRRRLERQEFDIEDDMADDNLEDVMKSLQSDFLREEGEEEEEEAEEDEDGDTDFYERAELPYGSPGHTAKGNGLPYGGTNSLALEMIYGRCVIEALVKHNNKMLAVSFIQTISNDEFFYPIPYLWLEPLLRFYQEFRENLENNQSG